MKITINGEDVTTEASTVRELIRQQDLKTDGKGIAIAVNGSVVPKDRWDEHRLNEEDIVEVVRATQGG